MRHLFALVFLVAGVNLSAEMPEFEKPPAGLKARVIEYWDKDNENLETEHFDRKVIETFNEKGELVSRYHEDSHGKTEKLTYKHVYAADGQILERQEFDDKGKILQIWSYKKDANGKLEIRLRMTLASGDMVCAYRFDEKGRLTELEWLECHGSKTKLVNRYQDDGRLKGRDELVEGKSRFTTEFEYNKDGVLRRAVRRNHMGYLAVEEDYNAAGDLEARTEYDYYGLEVRSKNSHEYAYNDAGQITEDDWMDGRLELRKLVFRRGHIYYKYEFYEKKK